MVFEIGGPIHKINVPRVDTSTRDRYHEVTLEDSSKLTTFEDWARAAQAGRFGYQFVLQHENSIPDAEFAAIVSACGDVPCGS
ncbi:MAG: hypothetical protein HYZ79_02145 [Candidatus Melainabacteria bacterium]|nr:hypothetical protein [Candidatus Melainabacteria bacterium]